MVAFRVIRGLFRGVSYGLVHGAIASSVVVIIWVFRQQLYKGAWAAVGLFTSALNGFGSFLSWLAPFIGAAARSILHLIIVLAQTGWYLAQLAIQTVMVIASSLVALIMTVAKLLLFMIFVPPAPLPTEKAEAQHIAGQTKLPAPSTVGSGDGSVEVFEARITHDQGSTESRLKFLQFSSDCSWRGASYSDIACDSGSTTIQFDDVMKRAAAAVSDAPRILIIGAASCEGDDRKKNELLAEDRARRLYERAQSAGLKDKSFIIVTLGQYQANDCGLLTDKQRAKQRPIVIAGIYTGAADTDLLQIVALALRQHPALPQVVSYSKLALIPIIR